MDSKIGAVIVTYEPNLNRLNSLIERLIPQVDHIVVVDNGSKISLANIIQPQNGIVFLNENLGIATAQNIGIKHLLMYDVQNVILFDQDSIPSESMVKDLFTVREQASELGINVAAVGPLHLDWDDSSEGVYVDTLSGKVKIIVPEDCRRSGNAYVQCDFLIASGCLISVESLNRIGLMDDELFIDCVDIEWGYRALDAGFHCIAAFDAKMYHKIGDESLRILGRNLTTHSPLRHYYFYRNFYDLLTRNYIPRCWKYHVLIKSSIQAVIFCLFLSPRLKHFHFILKGIYHGLVGRKGRYD
ncbi:MAG: glycosyltransferase family 2 protein [Shewanella sp.]